MSNLMYTDKKLNAISIYIITFVFFTISFVGIYFHEIWMDESHHFLLGRDSNSLIDVYKNTRYDGHPILWNSLMYIITRFSENPFYMQLLHISISSFVAYLFLKKASFKLWFKITFLLSYFMIYEYTVISRNYNLGVLFLFLSCSLYTKRKEHFTTFCLFLALCCNTHSIFTIVSSTLLFSVFIEQISIDKNNFIKKFWKGYAIFLIGITIAYYQIIPPSDTIFFDSINYSNLYETFKSSMSLFKALFPIVDFTTINYWNHFYLIEHFKILSLIIGILVWILPLLFFNKNKYVLFFVYATLFSFVAFEIFTRRYGVRYNGLLFITIIVGFWMLHSQKNQPLFKKNLHQFNHKIIVFLMLIQSLAGIIAYSLGVKHTFNNGKNMASYIIEKKLDTSAIVTACDSASINAFLKENLYNLCYQKKQGFYLWNTDCLPLFTMNYNELITEGFKQNPSKELLYFILNMPIELDKFQNIKDKKHTISLIQKFEGAVKHNYYMYLIKRDE